MESVRWNRETFVRSGHGLGKTFTLADLVLWFLYCFVPSKVITLAPSQRQVEQLLWAEIRKKWERANIKMGKMTRSRLVLDEDHFAEGISPRLDVGVEDQGIRTQGYHSPNTLILFDEAPGIHPAQWEVKEGLMSGAFARFCGVGNPVAAAGNFYTGYTKTRGGKLHMDIFKSPNFVKSGVTSLAMLEKLAAMPDSKLPQFAIPFPALSTVVWAIEVLRKWGPKSPLFISRVLGGFPISGTDALFPLAWLEASKASTPRSGGPKVTGVDIARFGSSETVLAGFDEGIQYLLEIHTGLDTEEVAGVIENHIKQDKPDAVAIDSTGLGAGVYDKVARFVSLRGIKCDIISVENGSRSEEPDVYVNLRAQSYYKAREMVKACDVQLKDDPDTFHQLASIRYRYAAGGLIQIESKESMRKRGIGSPDRADAVVMALHALDMVAPGRKMQSDSWMEDMVSDREAVEAEEEKKRSPWEPEE